jgi:hypothetical protein
MPLKISTSTERPCILYHSCASHVESVPFQQFLVDLSVSRSFWSTQEAPKSHRSLARFSYHSRDANKGVPERLQVFGLGPFYVSRLDLFSVYSLLVYNDAV